MGIANNRRRGINHRKVEIVYTSLGWHSPLYEVISSAILSILTFFYIYTVGSFLNIPVFLLEAGVTYGFPFDIYIFDEELDQAILTVGTLLWFAFSLRGVRLKVAVCSFYAIVTLLSFSVFGHGILETFSLMFGPLLIISFILDSLLKSKEKGPSKIISFNKGIYLTYLSIIAIFIGIISVLLNFDFFFHIEGKWYFRNYVYQIYLALAALSPVILILLVFGIPVKLISDKIISRITRWKDTGRLDGRNPKASPIDDRQNSNQISRIRKKPDQGNKFAVYLILIMLGSSALTLIPWYSTIIDESGEPRLIGVDTGFYMKWATDLIFILDKGEVLEALNQVFVVASNGDRPISLFFVFSVAKISQAFGEISDVINSIPAILAPLLVLAVYFVTREMTLDVRAALFAALLTTVSFQVSVGMYAGFYANWLALVAGYSCFGFLFKYLRTPTRANLTFFLVLLVILLLSHVYTWAMFTLGMGILLIILHLRKHYSRSVLRMPLLIILLVVLVHGFKSNLIGTDLVDTELVQVQVVELGLNFETLVGRWNTLTDTAYQFMGGLYGNSIIYLLCLYWLLKCRYMVPSNLLIFILLSTAVVPLLVGSWVVQSRVIYNIPFQIPAAIAMVYILQTSKESRAKYPEIDKELFIIAIFVWTLAISLRLLLNLSSD